MGYRFWLVLTCFALMTPASGVFAQSPTPQAADACTQVGTFVGNYVDGEGADGNLMVCDGTAWVPFLEINADASVVFKGIASAVAPTEDAHIANKGYVDSVAGGIESVAGAAVPSSGNKIGDLDDVSTSGVSDGACLTYNNSTSTWTVDVCGGGVNSVSGAAVPSSGNRMGDLDDVTTTGAANGNCLIYNSGTSKWEADACGDGVEFVTGAAVPSSGNKLADLDDVSTTGVGGGFCLVYNDSSSTWEAAGCGDSIESVAGAASPLFANQLDNLVDVNVSGVTDSECLVYDAASSIWGSGACGTGGGSTTAIELVAGANAPSLTNDIDDLLDVSISAPSNSQCLVYNAGSSIWQNGTCSAGSTTAIENVTGAAAPTYTNNLGDLSDVDVASPSTNDVLLWDGTNWIAQSGITSDRDLKNDIAPISASEVNKIHSLSAQSYTMKSDPTRTHFGFIAQDVAALYPNLVFENSKGSLSLDYIGLLAPMVEAIKELRAENEGLKTRIQALEENQQ